MPGVSGSLLINRFGEVCGLYYGNATSWVGPEGEEILNSTAGFAMSMTGLVHGIETRVWGEVSLGLP